MKIKQLSLIVFSFLISIVSARTEGKVNYQIHPFGKGGQHKMIYDRRQRPQALLMGDHIHLVYNGGAPASAEKIVKTTPFITTFNLKTGKFSDEIQLPGEPSRDHHYGPIIWADNNDYLNVFSGCHKTPGTHIVSKKPGNIGSSAEDWQMASRIAPSLSYPSASQIFNNQHLIYYRTGEHRSSWTYSTSSDNGNTWQTPENPIVDLNNMDELKNLPHKKMDEASSYHTYLASQDRKSIHIAFIYYDDNKGNLPEKSYNPLYKKNVGTLKTNLYYLKVNLETQAATNFEGREVATPLVLKDANAHCKIWDTHWRGSGVPPDIIIDKHNNPAFLHVLTEEIFEKLNYYYVRRVGNEWKQTIIAPACHKWNSSHLQMDKQGNLHAYLLMDDGYFESKGKGVMNNHGGGTRIEEWISVDSGNTWSKKDILFTARGEYSNWRFNNIQAVKTKDGKIKEGIFLFYGWEQKRGEANQAKAFLLTKQNNSN